MSASVHYARHVWQRNPARGRLLRVISTLFIIIPNTSCQSVPSSVPESGRARAHHARTIRVLLLRNADRIELAASSPFSIQDGNGNELSETLPPIPRMPILFRHNSPTTMVLGDNTYAGSVLDVVPEEDGTLGLMLPAGPGEQAMRRLPGVLRCILKDDGTAHVINIVDVEDYLRGVLRGELPPNWKHQTYRAQAIAARTYVFYEKSTVGRKRDWDVTATSRSQMYIGIDPDTNKTKAAKAVDDTRGLVLTWHYDQGDRIFCAYYSAVCGGRTRSGPLANGAPPIPPLAGGVACKHCWRAPKGTYRWGPKSLTKEHVRSALAERYEAFQELGPILSVQVVAQDGYGRAETLRITDEAREFAELSAEAFRLTVDRTGMQIKSARFSLQDDGKSVTFRNGHGWGHGMGMCQWGAEAMARQGRSAEEILAFYYPGARLTKAYD